MNHPIPEASLKKHIAILGMNGSGKTSVAKSEIIEPALEAGERVCNIDPTGVGWGLRLSATGKSKGYSVYIVGGEHADFPLFRRDGHAWAEIVGTSSDSFVFDTSQLTVSDRSQWFTDFAETLLRKNKGPLKLVIDEAHLFAPQGGAKGGGSTPDMLHATNNLLSLGRSRGLRITMISQRPAKLHKDSLTQAHTLIAMSLMAPHDRAAVSEWIADQADASRGKEIVASLPTLDPGEGWIWAPREKVLERVKFSRPRTFDSSSAPDDGDTQGPVLPPINPDAVKARLETVAKETVANDPKALRAEVAKLRAELAARPSGAPDAAALDAAFNDGLHQGIDEATAHCRDGIREAAQRLQDLAQKVVLGAADEMTASVRWTVPGKPAPGVFHRQQTFTPAPSSRSAVSTSPRANVSTKPPSDGFSRPQQRILDALAWLESVRIPSADRTRVAWLADASPKSSSFMNNLGVLSSGGMIRYPRQGAVELTEAGRSAANKPDAPLSSVELQASIQAKLPRPQWSICAALISVYPSHLSREDLASAAGASSNSSSFMNNLGTLRGLGLIDYPDRGLVAATSICFVE